MKYLIFFGMLPAFSCMKYGCFELKHGGSAYINQYQCFINPVRQVFRLGTYGEEIVEAIAVKNWLRAL